MAYSNGKKCTFLNSNMSSNSYYNQRILFHFQKYSKGNSSIHFYTILMSNTHYILLHFYNQCNLLDTIYILTTFRLYKCLSSILIHNLLCLKSILFNMWGNYLNLYMLNSLFYKLCISYYQYICLNRIHLRICYYLEFCCRHKQCI